MTLNEFIARHREQLTELIRGVVRNSEFEIDDEELRLWVLNDEGLYNWARSEGVRDDDEEEEGD